MGIGGWSGGRKYWQTTKIRDEEASQGTARNQDNGNSQESMRVTLAKTPSNGGWPKLSISCNQARLTTQGLD